MSVLHLLQVTQWKYLLHSIDFTVWSIPCRDPPFQDTGAKYFAGFQVRNDCYFLATKQFVSGL